MPALNSKAKSKQRVLLVDDDDHLRNLHGAVLTDEGYAVSHAANGLEALSLCQLHGFDLVIVELHLRCSHHLRIIETLRQQTADTKFIGTARVGALQPDYGNRMARHLGAHHVLTKPFPPEHLLSAARNVLTKKSNQ